MSSNLFLHSPRSRWRLQLMPERGGAWLGAEARDATGQWQPVLQPCPPAAVAADERLRYANYALVPFSNRIAEGQIRAVHSQAWPTALPPNWPGLAHPIHGVGWLQPWAAHARSSRDLTLRLSWPAQPAWPWPFQAWQRIRLLGARTLQLDLGLQNTGPRPMPAGLGWHPAFARRSQLALGLRAALAQRTGSDGLPTGRHDAAPAALAFGRLAAADALTGTDCAFDGWAGSARLRWPDVTLHLKAEGALARRLVIYAPAGADYICLEPVSHLNNALAQSHITAARWGLRWLAPGNSLQARVRLTLGEG